MGSCLKGKSEAENRQGAFRCKKCGGISEKKKHVCDPRKIEDKDVKKENKAGKKKK